MDLLLNILHQTWLTTAEMAPYLLFGFLVAGILSVFVSPELVERHLGGRGLWPVTKASLFGIPLPLCSCGVIPVGASLRRHGASRGATTSFLISTPQTGVDSILVTYSLLGPVITIFRPIAALLSGLLGGVLASAFGESRTPSAEAAEDSCNDGCDDVPQDGPRLLRALRYGFLTLPQDIARALIVGLVIAGVISALVPDDFFAGMLGGGFTPLLLMLLLGIPVYVCATGSVPIAAALLLKGVSPGAALVFLMTGPATNAATITTIWKVLGKRTAMIYLGTVAGTALLTGALLDVAIDSIDARVGMAEHSMLPHWIDTASAIILLALLGYALLARWRGRTQGEDAMPEGELLKLKVSGMNCNHCVGSVTRALSEADGVESAEVDLASGEARVHGRGLDDAALIEKIKALGFEATRA